MSRYFRTIAILLLTSLLVPSVGDAAIIRLRRTADIDSSLIRLGDIAEVYGDSSAEDAALKDINICPAPLAGTRIRLSVAEVQSQLAARGVPAGALDIAGSSVVLVSRKPEPRKSPEPKIIHPGPSHTLVSVSTEQPIKRRTLVSDVSARDFNLAQEVVEHLVRTHLEQAAPEWGTPKIQPLLTTTNAPRILQAREGNLQILSGQPLDDEHFLLTLAVPQAETEVDRVDVKVRIVRRPKVYAPMRPVSKGEVLTMNDLVQIETDDERNGIANPQDIIGMEAVTPLKTGVGIRAAQIKPPLLVRRGDTVQVTSRVGLVRVRLFLVAKQDGRRGETIPFEDIETKSIVPATITGRLQAEITGSGTVAPEPTPEQPTGTGLQLTVLNQ